MERLTYRNKHGDARFAGEGTPVENFKLVPVMLEKLAAYEDLEEQCRLIVLPCGIGDPAYIVVKDKKHGGFLQECFVAGIHLFDETNRRGLPREEYLVLRSACCGFSNRVPLKKVGEAVFFDRAEAEKAMEVSDDA